MLSQIFPVSTLQTRKHTTAHNSVLHYSDFYSFKYSIELCYKVTTQYEKGGGGVKRERDSTLHC